MRHSQGRRRFLRNGLFVAGLAIPVLLRADMAKLTKAMVQYQDYPRGNEICAQCLYYQPPAGSAGDGHCQRVLGRIAPKGYCLLYTPRA